MQKQYDAPGLTLIGQADEVVRAQASVVMTFRLSLRGNSHSSRTSLLRQKQNWGG